ncbi:MAG: MSHA biogenesis protein MshN [Colwellia sp.]|nr:MAG: MSHA biogenesis protein MshN [Colwellia sp.]
MSVINQMLKDLEQRTPEQGQAIMPVAISHKPSTIKIVLISLTVLISLNFLGFYIWNLQEQIQAKQQVSSSELIVKETIQVQPQVSSSELIVKETIQVQPQVSSSELIVKETIQVQPQVSSSELIVKEKIQVQPHVSSSELIVKEKIQVQQQVSNGELIVKEKSQRPVVKSELKTSVKKEIKKAKISQMSVSRRQLTSAELVTQKLVRAEKSIKINDIIKAEQLFEEVLIIEPSHKQARKKLAALWFGRKSYQQATNLLSQGIALDRNDAQLRLLKARIHLQQGQHQAVYNTLKPLSLIKQQEYQVMLANVSQHIEQFKSAAQAYKILIDMQGYSGRWHLGLAIVYDRNSQFSLAVTEYTLALTKSDLSIASAEFAQQRMQALGE